MDKKAWAILRKKCKENCFCDYCRYAKPFKRCKNALCGKLISREQRKAWLSGHCCNDCADELRGGHREERAFRYREEEKIVYREEGKKNMKWIEPQTHFPHRLYPDTVLIIEQDLSTK